MRAMLVVNHKATTTRGHERDVLTRALGSELKVDVVETQQRGHATQLAAQAVEAGLDLVVVLGGDGTVNEVINGLLGAGEWSGPDPNAPALAMVPGGSTNVFSRALGISRDPIEATGELLDALRSGHSRRLGLGRVDERWFTFTAGLGLDADAVRRVEAARAEGKPSTPSRYARATVRSVFALDRRHPGLTLERPGEEPVPGLFFGIVANTSPWTYFRDHPVVLTPDASFDAGLDLVSRDRMRLPGVSVAAMGMLTRKGIRGRHTRAFRDLREFRLVADRPTHLQVDGDYIGERSAVRFLAVPNALRVIA